MDRWLKFGSTACSCLTAALLAVAALAVPGQSAFGDDDPCAAQCSGYTVGSPQWYDCMNSCHYNFYGCANPINNGCPINNGNQSACPGILCATAAKSCDCTYNTTNNTCNCP